MSKTLLDISHVAKSFGGNEVLSDVSLTVQSGEIVGLLGPNGSGKSTLLNAASGFMPIDQGDVLFCGKSVRNMSPHQIVKQGIARTFQLPSMPSKMSVIEVLVAAGANSHGLWRSLWRSSIDVQADQQILQRAHELIDSLMLTRVKDLSARALSGGQKKLLSIACGLMRSPKLLMLDEPTAGVHPNLRRDIVKILQKINQDNGISQLIVEHDMYFVREVCTRCVVLDRGHIVADCTPDELVNHPRVIEAYLGQARAGDAPKTEVAA